MENSRTKEQGRKAISPRLLKTQQASQYLAISVCELRLLVRKGVLPVVHLSGDSSRFRFDVRDLDGFIERSKETLNNGL